MVMSVEQLKDLTMKGINFGVADIGYTTDEEKFYVMFSTENYENAEGENQLRFLTELAQDGGILRLSCPMALNASGGKADIYLASCMVLQSSSFVFKFEYDEDDGEVKPCVEIIVPDDGGLTPEEMYYPMLFIKTALDEHYQALEATKKTGEVLEIG